MDGRFDGRVDVKVVLRNVTKTENGSILSHFKSQGRKIMNMKGKRLNKVCVCGR